MAPSTAHNAMSTISMIAPINILFAARPDNQLLTDWLTDQPTNHRLSNAATQFDIKSWTFWNAVAMEAQSWMLIMRCANDERFVSKYKEFNTALCYRKNTRKYLIGPQQEVTEQLTWKNYIITIHLLTEESLSRNIIETEQRWQTKLFLFAKLLLIQKSIANKQLHNGIDCSIAQHSASLYITSVRWLK